jgi:hypothetical protein
MDKDFEMVGSTSFEFESKSIQSALAHLTIGKPLGTVNLCGVRCSKMGYVYTQIAPKFQEAIPRQLVPTGRDEH